MLKSLTDAAWHRRCPSGWSTSNNFGFVRFMLVGLGLALLVVFRPQGIFGNRRSRRSMSADPAASAPTSSRPCRSVRRRSRRRAGAGVAKPDPILIADGVRRTFGGLVAVDVEHVEVQRNSITALIGPNGAGKTTFFNLLTGFDKPDAGDWSFDGRPMSGVAAAPARPSSGMVRTFQLTKSLTRLSVIENMRLGAPQQQGERFWAAPFRSLWRDEERAITERAEAPARAVQAGPHARRVRRLAVGRAAQAARDGARADGRARG